jgi:hypothetical protein
MSNAVSRSELPISNKSSGVLAPSMQINGVSLVELAHVTYQQQKVPVIGLKTQLPGRRRNIVTYTFYMVLSATSGGLRRLFELWSGGFRKGVVSHVAATVTPTDMAQFTDAPKNEAEWLEWLRRDPRRVPEWTIEGPLLPRKTRTRKVSAQSFPDVFTLNFSDPGSQELLLAWRKAYPTATLSATFGPVVIQAAREALAQHALHTARTELAWKFARGEITPEAFVRAAQSLGALKPES